jgi:5-oxoprolinase (ATP-hydrolysing)
MPPDARSLAEEGTIIPPLYLVRRGTADWPAIERLFASGPYPSRAVRDNLADLRAQVAANHRGASLLGQLARRHGLDIVREQMDLLTGRAEARSRAAIRKLGPSTREARQHLDDGSELVVRITIAGERAIFDSTGTSGVHPGNLNATPAIVRSVVLYVVRLLIDEPLPLNEGLLRPIGIVLPRPSLLDPGFTVEAERLPAVVGGNTEVSQRLVDTVLRALSMAAGSQGTMNNVLWGNPDFGYYETLGGGTGAGPGYDGESGVHSHMTNTRITDVEVLERRYPVRVERFAIRQGSGGGGRHRGGDGLVREITFLAPVALSVLTQRRREGPDGLDGGRPGAAGRQTVTRASGGVLELGAVDGCDLAPGDRLSIETPGGGGWGSLEAERRGGSIPDRHR